MFKRIREKNAQFKSDLNISLTGNIDSSVVNSLQENGLKEQLSIEGFAAHHTAVQRMLDASLLLFVIPVSERNHLIITGKFVRISSNRKPYTSYWSNKWERFGFAQRCSKRRNVRLQR